ncbi:MAG: hydrogenase maturation nickel metallochaperone HypA [Lachnospiraceae bacterium]|nr:hydrogenase maturation nickel metallochaperone HypA [Lachnospiraceae bacterium]
MHELSITKNILDVATKTVTEGKVRKINLLRGEYSDVIPEYVQNCFDKLSAGTICEGAVLEFHSSKPVVSCRDCGRESELEVGQYECPSCGSMNVRILRGLEFVIESLEVD